MEFVVDVLVFIFDVIVFVVVVVEVDFCKFVIVLMNVIECVGVLVDIVDVVVWLIVEFKVVEIVFFVVVVVYVDEIGVFLLIFVVKDFMFLIVGCSVVFLNEDVGIIVVCFLVDIFVFLFVWKMFVVGFMVVFIEVLYFFGVDSLDLMVKFVDVEILDVNIVVFLVNCVVVLEWVIGWLLLIVLILVGFGVFIVVFL